MGSLTSQPDWQRPAASAICRDCTTPVSDWTSA